MQLGCKNEVYLLGYMQFLSTDDIHVAIMLLQAKQVKWMSLFASNNRPIS